MGKATGGLVQHGIGKIGAEVVNLSIGILIKICARLNICALNAPTSPIPKTLCVTLKPTAHLAHLVFLPTQKPSLKNQKS